MDNASRPQVGITVMIFNTEGKVLAGKRKGSHGEGETAFFGGHLETMESFEECARREVREELNIEIRDLKFLNICNLVAYAPKHYVDVVLVCHIASGTPTIMEPNKLESLGWYTISELPEPLFAGCKKAIESLRGDIKCWDKDGIL